MTNPYFFKIEVCSSNEDISIDSWILNEKLIINKLVNQIGKSNTSYSLNNSFVLNYNFTSEMEVLSKNTTDNDLNIREKSNRSKC